MLDAIAARHDVLRTSLRSIDGRVMQIVSPRVDVPLRSTVLDSRGQKRSRRLGMLIQRGLDQPFDLAVPPLIRAMVIRLGPLDHILGLVVPHTIWDAACAPVFAQEFVALYDTVAAGEPPPREPSIQLGDFAQWQRTCEDPAARAYWEQQLAGAEPRLGLPLDRQHACRHGYRVREVPLSILSRSLGERLRGVSNDASGMLAMTLVAATAVVLSAHTGQDDLTMALMHANRDLPETQELLGFIADVAPLRVSVPRRRSFRGLVHDIAAVTRDAHRHMLPSGQLEQLLASPPEVMVNPQQLRPPIAVSTRTGLRLTDYRPESWWKMHPTRAVWYRAPIDVDFRARGNGTIAASVSYNVEALDDVTGRRLATDLEAILKRAALDPDRSIQRLCDVIL